MKDFERALTVLSQAWETFEARFGGKSEQVGNIYLEMAAVYGKKKDLDAAIETQTKAYLIFSELDKFANSDFLAHIAITLAEFQEKQENYDAALGSLKQAKQILEDNYTTVDKRTCKVKRNISLLYLKSN